MDLKWKKIFFRIRNSSFHFILKQLSQEAIHLYTGVLLGCDGALCSTVRNSNEVLDLNNAHWTYNSLQAFSNTFGVLFKGSKTLSSSYSMIIWSYEPFVSWGVWFREVFICLLVLSIVQKRVWKYIFFKVKKPIICKGAVYQQRNIKKKTLEEKSKYNEANTQSFKYLL